MSCHAGPNTVEDGLRLSFDAANFKSYPGSGNTMFSLNNNSNATATSFTTANDATSGTVYNFNGSSNSLIFNLNPAVNHEVWSMIFWIRSTGTTPSNYKGVVRLEQTGGPGYFYIVDTREVATSYILGYQKDYAINDWLTTNFNTPAQWAEQKWWCFGVSHNNKVFKSYRQGELFATQTQTRSVDAYTDLTQIQINHSTNNTVHMGAFYFYDRILTDAEFRQHFNALRGRFGI
jgi:hypothetical protein